MLNIPKVKNITNLPNNIKILHIEKYMYKILHIDYSILYSLIEFSIEDSLITRLSKDVGKLQNLEGLYLSHNYLKKLPTSICKLKNLKALTFGDNDIKEIPECISKLNKLEHLYMYDLNLSDKEKERLKSIYKNIDILI